MGIRDGRGIEWDPLHRCEGRARAGLLGSFWQLRVLALLVVVPCQRKERSDGELGKRWVFVPAPSRVCNQANKQVQDTSGQASKTIHDDAPSRDACLLIRRTTKLNFQGLLPCQNHETSLATRSACCATRESGVANGTTQRL